jgi:hypothetical protein
MIRLSLFKIAAFSLPGSCPGVTFLFRRPEQSLPDCRGSVAALQVKNYDAIEGEDIPLNSESGW